MPLPLPLPQPLTRAPTRYGRGPVGHAFEAACAPCAGAPAGSGGAPAGSGGAQVGPVRDRVSPFYRAFLGLSLARLGQLEPTAAAAAAKPAHWLRALWISRGKGHGGAYGSTVARRCLNEDALRAAAARAAAQDEARGERAVRLSAVELADLPFTQQLPLFRSAAILTGMHGAGCAPPATPPRGACTPRQLPHCLLLPPGRCEPDLPDSWVGGRRAVPARLLHQLVRAHLAPARAHLPALDEQHPSQRQEKLRHRSGRGAVSRTDEACSAAVARGLEVRLSYTVYLPTQTMHRARPPVDQ